MTVHENMEVYTSKRVNPLRVRLCGPAFRGSRTKTFQ